MTPEEIHALGLKESGAHNLWNGKGKDSSRV
jgi:hypothetical protein